MRTADLSAEAYHPFYKAYVEALGDVELLPMLRKQKENFPQFLASIPEDKLHDAYDEGKWTVAEVLMHILDSERVFQYRALRIGRGDITPLPGFDQNAYVPNSGASKRTVQDIIDEYIIIRTSTIALFERFTPEVLKQTGTASGTLVSLAALGFIICGHQKHHKKVLVERYLGD